MRLSFSGTFVAFVGSSTEDVSVELDPEDESNDTEMESEPKESAIKPVAEEESESELPSNTLESSPAVVEFSLAFSDTTVCSPFGNLPVVLSYS